MLLLFHAGLSTTIAAIVIISLSGIIDSTKGEPKMSESTPGNTVNKTTFEVKTPQEIFVSLECSSNCSEALMSTIINNGWLHCEGDFVRLECYKGYYPSFEDSFDCQILNHTSYHLNCLVENEVEEEILLMFGGDDEKGILSKAATIFPHDDILAECLPSLPVALKWGAIGLIGSSLLICGGEDMVEQPQSMCWILDNRSHRTSRWRQNQNLTRYRFFLMI